MIEEHHDPDQVRAGLLDAGGQPAGGHDQGVQGEAKWLPATSCWASFNLEAFRVSTRAAADEVTFDIDANGILHVSAKDKATARKTRSRSRPTRV